MHLGQIGSHNDVYAIPSLNWFQALRWLPLIIYPIKRSTIWYAVVLEASCSLMFNLNCSTLNCIFMFYTHSRCNNFISEQNHYYIFKFTVAFDELGDWWQNNEVFYSQIFYKSVWRMQSNTSVPYSLKNVIIYVYCRYSYIQRYALFSA